MGFESIRRIIPQAIQQANVKVQIDAVRILEVTLECITQFWGEEKARFIQPISFQKGELKIKALSPVAAQEFRQIQQRVQNEVNKKMGTKTIQSIKVLFANGTSG